MKAKVMNAMQSFSKALMGPVLFLPIAGMLQALSSVMCNTAFVSEGGILYTAGKFINGGVSAVIGNLGILFCVGVSMSLAKKKNRTREEDDMLDMMLHGGERVKAENLSGVLEWYSA